jgi:hypothetical protein
LGGGASRARTFAQISQSPLHLHAPLINPKMTDSSAEKVGVELISSNFKRLKAVYYSEQRDEIFTAAAEGIFSFQPNHGRNGLYHHLAGKTYTHRVTYNDWHRDGVGKEAQFSLAKMLTMCEDPDGELVIADGLSRSIRRLSMHNQSVCTIHGGPHGDTIPRSLEHARPLENHDQRFIAHPTGVLYDHDGHLIIVDEGTHRVMRIKSDGIVQTLGGQFKRSGMRDGSSLISQFQSPFASVLLPGIGFIVTDSGNRRIRCISPTNTTTTIAGNGEAGTLDGPTLSASFSDPKAICINVHGDIIVQDSSTKRIRLISGGMVSTILKPRMYPGLSMGNAHFGMDVNGDGNILIAADSGLYRFNTPTAFRKRWKRSKNSSNRLSFLSLQNIGSWGDESLRERLCPFRLYFIHVGRTLYLPNAIISLRCPGILKSEARTALEQLPLSDRAVDIFHGYILGDTLPTFASVVDFSLVVELAAIAYHCELAALLDHCNWLIFTFSHNPKLAANLIAAVKTSIDVHLETATFDIMRAIVTHNNMFAAAEDIALLKSVLPLDENAKLKQLLKANTILPLVRERSRTSERLFGMMSQQLSLLLQLSLDGTPMDADMRLICEKDGNRFAIHSHSFVLYSRWMYIRPLLKYTFRESVEGELELLKPDGTLFDFSWVSTFLSFLYSNNVACLGNDSFVAITRENSDYLQLRRNFDLEMEESQTSNNLDEPYYDWLISMMELITGRQQFAPGTEVYPPSTQASSSSASSSTSQEPGSEAK